MTTFLCSHPEHNLQVYWFKKKTFIPVFSQCFPEYHPNQWFHQNKHFPSKSSALLEGASMLRAVARPSSCGWHWRSAWPVPGWAPLSGSCGSVGCKRSRSPRQQQCRSGRWHCRACWSPEWAGWPVEAPCRRAQSSWTPLYWDNWREEVNGSDACIPPLKNIFLKDKVFTYKLLKRGRSRVLLVSMATMLGTSELITEDLNVKKVKFRRKKF